MALGGGTFVTQNKVLPGSYINFVSAARATANLSERGIVAFPMEMDWGAPDVFTVDAESVQKNALSLFGYDYTQDKLKNVRELFRHAKTVHFFRLQKLGVVASCNLGNAKYSGIRGNDLRLTIEKNVDDPLLFDVHSFIDDIKIDSQTVGTSKDLMDNDFIVYKKTESLSVTASTPFTGGTNGAAITGTEYQDFLNKIEAYHFNALGCDSIEESIKDLMIAFTKRMRDDVGVKFQCVLHQKQADYEGVVSVENTIEEAKISSLVYWVSGIISGCAINKSNTNKRYDGEYTVLADYTQRQLSEALKEGKFIFHKVAKQVRVLEDINTFVRSTPEKNSDFNSNQTIRILDQIANDIATLFNNRYLGEVPNDADGRISLWNDIVKHHLELQQIRAIQNFIPDSLTVSQGELKKSVVVNDLVEITNAMTQLYMSVVVA